jgi:hypothetical protein
MLGVARRADRHHRLAFGNLAGRAQHRGTAQAVADQDRGRHVGLTQVRGGGDKVGNVGREIRIGELAFARAKAGEVEAQRGDAVGGELLGDAARRKDVLAAGEAMGEQRKRARVGRHVETSRQIAPGRAGKLDLPRFDHVQLLVGSRLVR